MAVLVNLMSASHEPESLGNCPSESLVRIILAALIFFLLVVQLLELFIHFWHNPYQVYDL